FLETYFSSSSFFSFLSNTKSTTHKIETLPPYLNRPPPLHHRKVAAAASPSEGRFVAATPSRNRLRLVAWPPLHHRKVDSSPPSSH
ncbi:hypothetical protein LINPERPRIM_LOCUS983, partial [Linum perenne]